MNCEEVKIKMHDFIDNLLSSQESADFEASIVKCPKEFNKFEKLNKLITNVRSLPLSYEPDKKILMNITDKLMSAKIEKTSNKSQTIDSRTESKINIPTFEPEKIVLERDLRKSAKKRNLIISFTVLMLLGILVYFLYNTFIIQNKPWIIQLNEGSYTINLKKTSLNQISDGDILKVNAGSNLKLFIPEKGFFVLNEITSLKLVNSDINYSQIEVQNPNFRFVTTAPEFNLKINIGDYKIINKKCVFYLHPASSDTFSLNVFNGHLEVISKRQSVKIVKGYECKLFNKEISIPVHHNTSVQIKKLSEVLSTSPNNVNPLLSLLIISQKKDVFTLFELLKRANAPNREIIFEKIQNNFRIPTEISRTDILLQKPEALETYWQSIYNQYTNLK